MKKHVQPHLPPHHRTLAELTLIFSAYIILADRAVMQAEDMPQNTAK